jgi:hypothetical protein
MSIRALVIKLLLRLLNSRWLNSTPCAYGFIGNVDAFSLEYLRAEARQRTGITVAQIIYEADLFRSCPMTHTGLYVIEDGKVREANIWDRHELRAAFTIRKPEQASDPKPPSGSQS